MIADGYPAKDGGTWAFGDIDTVRLAPSPVVYVNLDSLACTPLPAGSLIGKVVLIHRGSCEFGCKAFNAQQAGAAGVLMINNQPGHIGMLGGSCGIDVHIPVLMMMTLPLGMRSFASPSGQALIQTINP